MIQIQQLFLQYGDRILFDEIDLSISPGEKVGLVGRNGAGKSTLLKLMAGEQKADGGQINYPRETTICYLHQDLLIRKELTVMELARLAFDDIERMEKRLEVVNTELAERTDYESDAYSNLIVELGTLTDKLHVLEPGKIEADIERVLKGLGFRQEDFQRPLGEFSGGWQMRVELARMLLQRPDFLLLDEPTNHLDIESIIWLEGFLKNYPGTVILISHDRQFLDHITLRTIEIELGKAHDYKANYSRYLVLREERREKLVAAYENQQRVIAEKERTISRFMAKASKTKMAQSMQKQLQKMDRIEMDNADTHAMNLRFAEPPRSAEVVVKAEKIYKSYGDLKVLEEVDFQLERGQKIAFIGQNGQGKTTLAKMLVGAEQPSSGVIQLGSNVFVGYYAQNQAETLDPKLTLLQTLELRSPEEMRPRLRGILGSFMFSGEDVDKRVSVLSGGERARLALAALLLHPLNFLLLDEPTNHLDMLSKDVLKSALKNYKGTLLVVSHDRDFLRGLTDTVVEFRNRRIHTFLGDIDYYLERRAFEDMRQVELKDANTSAAAVTVRTAEPLQPEALRQVQRQIQNAERRISKLEEEIRTLEQEMADPAFYEKADSKRLLNTYEQKKEELAAQYQSWEELAQQVDN